MWKAVKNLPQRAISWIMASDIETGKSSCRDGCRDTKLPLSILGIGVII
jgi:hypothetical protein